jgi:hypothetical protein
MAENFLNLDNLKPGDVILFPPQKGDWIAQAIAYLTQSEVNHAALCYDDGGKKKILESVLDGLTLRDFDKSVPIQYPLRISRLKTEPSDMEPLMKAGENYLKNKDTYPFFNLGMLAGLLLFKKFSKNTMADAVTYKLLELVALTLMKTVQNQYKNKHPMTCSQFVAQCFTDAGSNFDFKFDKLVIDYDSKGSSKKISFLELIVNSLKQTGARGVSGTGEQISFADAKEISKTEKDDIEKNPEKIVADFGALLKAPESASTGARGVVTTKISNNVGKPLETITIELYKILSGQETADIKVAQDYLNKIKSGAVSGTARNFFVAPEDIFSNCTNLKKVGLLAY